MLKHVSSTSLHGFRTNKPRDTVSLTSTGSTGSGGPEPLSSRSSSSSSLHDPPAPKTVVKVFAKELCLDVEYKTLSISHYTTSREVVRMLLNKFRMRHRDPNLFFLTMEVWMRKTGIPMKSLIALDDDARPAELQACHPRGDSKFFLRMRKGGLVKVYDSCLMSGSLYKSLLISDKTTVEELIQLHLYCYSSMEQSSKFELYEICVNNKYERKLRPHDFPLQTQLDWPMPSQMAFELRRRDSKSKMSWNTLITKESSPNHMMPEKKLSPFHLKEFKPVIFNPSSQSGAFNNYENCFYI